MVRVYQPDVKFSDRRDSRMHRYFKGDQIQKLGPDEMVEVLVNGAARRRLSVATGIVASLDDIASVEREQRLEELRSRPAG